MRTTLVTVSIVGHIAVGVGLFASGVWKLEKLDNDFRTPGIGMMTPSLGGGGQQDRPKQEFKKKDKTEKKIAKDVQWDKRVDATKATPKITDDGEPGEGEGPGKGPGKGPGDETGTKDGTCVLGPCDETPPVVEVPKLPDPPKVVNVPPTVMQSLRISGETQIHPSRVVQNQILADGKSKVVGTLKVCIQPSGSIASVTVWSSTKYPAYDQQLLEAAQRWHYRPFMVNNVAVSACSAVSFVYSIK